MSTNGHLQHHQSPYHPQSSQQHSYVVTVNGVNQLPTIKIESRDVYECEDSLSNRAHAAVVAAVSNTNSKQLESVSSEEDAELVYDNGDNRSSSTKEDMNSRKEYEEYEDDYYSDESENDRYNHNKNNQLHQQNHYQHGATSNGMKPFGDSAMSNNVRKHSLENVDVGNTLTNSSTSSNEINASGDAITATNSKTNNNGSNLKTPGLICVVCGASANGYNFDRITCESCKAFFRRNAFRPLVSQYNLNTVNFSVM